MTEVEGLSPDVIKANTQVIDITGDPAWLAAARWEITASYSKLVDPSQAVRMRDIYAAVSEDGYERDDRSRTIAALTMDPVTQWSEISAVLRVVFGRDGDVEEPIDAMHWVRPVEDWPHRRLGMEDSAVCEWGRFIIIDKFRTPAMKAHQIDALLCGLLCQAAMKMTRGRGIHVTYAIMPEHVVDLVKRSGYPSREIPAALREDSEKARQLFDRFSVYWRRLAPKLYQIEERRSSALTHFRTSLPTRWTIDDVDAIGRQYARNVTGLHRRIPLALRPEQESDVARIVAAANEHGIALYPFSTGKNWGLGSKLPVTDDCVVVDLSRMDRIIEVNEPFAYAILEPGVTQLQLATHLNRHHPSLTLNFTGSFAYSGIVGNVLERGDGAHARVDDLLGVRGILGSGRPFATGGFWDEVGSGRPSHVSRHVAGPDLCGLFCQSNFGIITQLAFRLVRKPDRRFILWGSAPDASLERLVDTLRGYSSQGAINPGSINIGYANRFVQARGTLSGDAGRAEAEEWNFYVLIGGPTRSTEALAHEIVGAIEPLCGSSGAFAIGKAPGDHDSPEKLPAFLQPLVAPLLGMPDAESIKLIYRLTGTPLPSDESDIDADHTPFGMKCYIPIVPPAGSHVRRAADIAADLQRLHGVNLKASFFGDGRTLMTIHFRRDDPEQVRLAEACEAALWTRMMEAGFPPYRVSIDQMSRLIASRPEFFDGVARIKSVLDPNGIIAPGRYCPAGERTGNA